ncbi:MAG: hypothetical protein AB7W28_05025 [Armatimonadota bacterium]
MQSFRVVIHPQEGITEGVTEAVAQALSLELRAESVLGPAPAIPESAYSVRRRQYHAGRLLRGLTSTLGADCSLALVTVDLFVKGLNFVFGVAQGTRCVVSTVRLLPEVHTVGSSSLFWRRVSVEAVHEVSHTRGLSHCLDPQCVMHYSNSVADTDRKGAGLCVRCKTLLVASPATVLRGEQG